MGALGGGVPVSLRPERVGPLKGSPWRWGPREVETLGMGPLEVGALGSGDHVNLGALGAGGLGRQGPV